MARIDGYLRKSYFKEGDYVKKGQTLFLIEPEQWLYNVQKARAAITNTRAQLTYAEKQLKRGEILVKKDYIAKAEYDQLVSNRDAFKRSISYVSGRIKRRAKKLWLHKLYKAPVDGQVGMITVTVGTYVNPSAGALTTIFSKDPIYVTFPIDSKEYIKLTEMMLKTQKEKLI